MSGYKDPRFPIELGGKEYHLYFSLSVLEEMQEKYGGFDKLNEVTSGKDGLKNVIWLLTRAVNEGLAYGHFLKTGDVEGAEVMSEKVAGLLLNTANLSDIKTDLFKAFAFGVKGNNDPPEDEDPDDEDDEENEKGNTEAGKVT